MNNKRITRREFLKLLGIGIIAVFIFPFKYFFKDEETANSPIKNKKAKYYSRADHLAG